MIKESQKHKKTTTNIKGDHKGTLMMNLKTKKDKQRKRVGGKKFVEKKFFGGFVLVSRSTSKIASTRCSVVSVIKFIALICMKTLE